MSTLAHAAGMLGVARKGRRQSLSEYEALMAAAYEQGISGGVTREERARRHAELARSAPRLRVPVKAR